MDQQDDSGVVRVARNAAEVLANEAYVMAMASLKEQIVYQWKECPVRDVEGQRLLLQLAKLAEKFDGILAGYVQSGRLAQHRIDLDNERNESTAARTARTVRRAFSR
jgi:hypothetical protein